MVAGGLSCVSDGNFGGTPRSFLFSITNDCKIPYHGRVKGPRQDHDDAVRREVEDRQRMEMHRCVVAVPCARGSCLPLLGLWLFRTPLLPSQWCACVGVVAGDVCGALLLAVWRVL